MTADANDARRRFFALIPEHLHDDAEVQRVADQIYLSYLEPVSRETADRLARRVAEVVNASEGCA